MWDGCTSQSLKSLTAFCSRALVSMSTRSRSTFCRLPSCGLLLLCSGTGTASSAAPFADIVRVRLPLAELSAGLSRQREETYEIINPDTHHCSKIVLRSLKCHKYFSISTGCATVQPCSNKRALWGCHFMLKIPVLHTTSNGESVKGTQSSVAKPAITICRLHGLPWADKSRGFLVLRHFGIGPHEHSHESHMKTAT